MSSVRKPTNQEREYWDRLLVAEGLSVHAGDTDHRLVYVENTDLFQSRKTKTGKSGGRLRGYALGDKHSNNQDCLFCGRAFTAKRNDARFCTDKCRYLAWVTKNSKRVIRLKDSEGNK